MSPLAFQKFLTASTRMEPTPSTNVGGIGPNGEYTTNKKN